MAHLDFPRMLPSPWMVEPVPRRVRAVLGGRTVLDTTAAHYVWEWPGYPQFYVPLDDLDPELLEPSGPQETDERGTFERRALRGHAGSAVVVTSSTLGIESTARFVWEDLDAWYEEDEQVFVHPRNPYTRVDALPSSRHVRIELDGVVLAESSAPVLVFETGLPTRYYLPRTAVRFEHLRPTTTVSQCPYKGRTSGWWSVVTPSGAHEDLAWSYDFPTRQLLPIAGMVAFYNEKLDHVVDGVRLERPVTRFS